jgi:2-hydroxychromene-2-carboxylate isomerase
MAGEVEFLFDFGSPTAYLAYTQLPQIAAQRKAQILWRPILLGGVHKASGNNSPISGPPKGPWMFHAARRSPGRFAWYIPERN